MLSHANADSTILICQMGQVITMPLDPVHHCHSIEDN